MRRPRVSPSFRRHLGLTLVEVLATITVIAIVIPVAMHGLGIASGLASVSRQRTEATTLAETKLNELVVSGNWQLTAGSTGDFGEQGPGFRWESAASAWDEPDLYLLQVSVHWTSRGRDREAVLSTLVYRPAEAP